MKKYIAIFIILCACQPKEDIPYESFVRNLMIDYMKIDPLIEAIFINETIDSAEVRSIMAANLKERKEYIKAEAHVSYENAKKEYERQKSAVGKKIADQVYLSKVNFHKSSYERILQGIYPQNIHDMEMQLNTSIILQEITIRYKVSNDGPTKVERIGIMIQNTDTVARPLQNNQPITDILK